LVVVARTHFAGTFCEYIYVVLELYQYAELVIDRYRYNAVFSSLPIADAKLRERVGPMRRVGERDCEKESAEGCMHVECEGWEFEYGCCWKRISACLRIVQYRVAFELC
jgi:hypothetical protein